MSFLIALDQLSSEQAKRAGGKAANLARVIQADSDVATPQNSAVLLADAVEFDTLTLLPAARKELHAFVRGVSRPLAVRSSAMCEDMPGVSAAGQHDTILNVEPTAAAVDAAVGDVLRSLRKPGAAKYREALGIAEKDAQMAVLLQEMVPDVRVAGVLFSANPLTGRRDEMLVNVGAGLADELVSGKTHPESLCLGADASQWPASMHLKPVELASLVACARRVVHAMGGAPQDIEFTVSSNGALVVVQTRDITTLFPVPAALADASPPCVLWSFAVTQSTYAPWSPLGQSIYVRYLSAMAKFVAGNLISTENFLAFPGERGFFDVTILLENAVIRFFLFKVIGIKMEELDDTTANVLKHLAREPTWQSTWLGMLRDVVMAPLVMARTFFLVAYFIAIYIRLMIGSILYATIWPEASADAAVRDGEKAIQAYRRCMEETETAADAILLIDINSPALKHMIDARISSMGMLVGMRCLSLVKRLAPANVGSPLLITRGLANNPTTMMNKQLSDIALRVRQDASPAQLAQWRAPTTTPETLAALYRARRLEPLSAQTALDAFLERFGMRAPSEIDCGKPRYVERPALLLQQVQLMVASTAADDELNKLRAAEREAEAWVTAAVAEVERTRSFFVAALFRFAVRRVRALYGLREAPKYHFVRGIGWLRMSLLRHAEAFVSTDVLDDAHDVVYLSADELLAYQAGTDDGSEWRARVAARRRVEAREAHRRAIPNVLVTDGRAFYNGWRARDDTADAIDDEMARAEAAQGVLRGVGVSPGVVSGRACVVDDPAHADALRSGDILVARATDPAWTVLFLNVRGLVMDTGGALVHGAVASRELGLPAVVGVRDGTTRIKTGDMIKVDGNAGVVVMLDGDDDEQ